MNIQPTHECFTDVMEFYEELIESEPADDVAKLLLRYELMHGICAFPDGELYAHAWLWDRECDTYVISGLFNGERIYVVNVPKDMFCEEFRPQFVARYTAHEASIENFRTGHYGPWIREIWNLCSDVKRRRNAKRG